ncbi:hypothetical protein BDV96DRAFT_676470 [Lophiotrema nucula]|uniref:Uncharacterized protein n=1 Tax=Lophiotrema nucula TaxID=690887 RepID=A0A6A5ZK52_9PLEO|nr:hypothetical protein BDV96DRAFT_676470 [Lophiotrema nucula]
MSSSSNTDMMDRLEEFEQPLPSLSTTKVKTSEDVKGASRHLTELPNRLLLNFYGDRIEFRNNINLGPGAPPCVLWRVKKVGGDGTSHRPLAVLLCLERGSIKQLITSGGHASKTTGEYGDLGKLSIQAQTAQVFSGCDYVAVFDLDTLWCWKFNGAYNDESASPPLAGSGPPAKYRTMLTGWLGGAVHEAGVRMLQSLPGRSLEDSNFECFGFKPMNSKVTSAGHQREKKSGNETTSDPIPEFAPASKDTLDGDERERRQRKNKARNEKRKQKKKAAGELA